MERHSGTTSFIVAYKMATLGLLVKFSSFGSLYGSTKSDNALLEIKRENEKLKKTRKANITTDTGRDQFMTKRARAASSAKNTATTNPMKVA